MNEIDAQLALGVELFNRGEFFEAHEAMEDAMNLLDDDTADWDFYLGLLRASVANHKLGDGELSSARLHLRAALKFLAPYPDRHRGIKLREFRSALTAELARLDSQATYGHAAAHRARRLMIPFTDRIRDVGIRARRMPAMETRGGCARGPLERRQELAAQRAGRS